ncbi:MAG: 16S rRNA (cytidine(1402)-2'-O)-methyltransferase [Bacteroidota bacterium]|nr:16S rRNA (cytidine(1402)-2'-O)-methyltransferase [Bacteroidota bacterium]
MPKLILVPTPIGNLEDITLRALRELKECDVILCEDTRTSSVLLKHYEISKPLQSYHTFNEHKTVENLINRIRKGEKMCLITDAGTPGISDPGFLIVRACIQNNIEVDCLPGATAFVPALVKSGIPSDSFVFEGFLPVKKGRQTKFKEIAIETRTMIIYESPFRVIKTLTELVEYIGKERIISVSRELSKKFEETVNGTISEVLFHFSKHDPKGEFVIIISGKPKKSRSDVEQD